MAFSCPSGAGALGHPEVRQLPGSCSRLRQTCSQVWGAIGASSCVDTCVQAAGAQQLRVWDKSGPGLRLPVWHVWGAVGASSCVVTCMQAAWGLSSCRFLCTAALAKRASALPTELFC